MKDEIKLISADDTVKTSNSSLTCLSSVSKVSNYDFLDDRQYYLTDCLISNIGKGSDFQENPSESLNLNNLPKQKDFIHRYHVMITTDRKSTRAPKKALSFSTLEVRYYILILGKCHSNNERRTCLMWH